jgi:hypothetical protein
MPAAHTRMNQELVTAEKALNSSGVLAEYNLIKRHRRYEVAMWFDVCSRSTANGAR